MPHTSSPACILSPGTPYGHERDTLIGALAQPNQPGGSWVSFFRDYRLLEMAKRAYEEGKLSSNVVSRIERLAADLPQFLPEPDRPALIHGDLWTNNILCKDGRVVGLIDPAIYFAHHEIELAYATLFNSLGEPFLRAYNAIRPIAPEFFETRRDIYNLYPLLSHVRHFGGGYVNSVDLTLQRFGY